MQSDLGWHVHLTSSRFDHKSQLAPPGAPDQGNYGRDLAEHLRDGLHTYGVQGELADEEWGWEVRAPLEGGAVLEIVVFYMGDDAEGNDPDLWELSIHAFKRKKQLFIFSRRVDVPVPEEVLSAIRKTLLAGGAKIVRFEAGPA